MKTYALVLIDVQKGFDDTAYWGPRNNPDFEKNTAKLLSEFRKLKGHIIHVRHYSLEPRSPLRPDSAGSQFMDLAEPHGSEAVFTKSVNSAFIGTSLEQYLRQHKIENLAILGLTTDHCVSTSTRMAANLGFHVTLIEDCLATHDRKGFNGRHFPAQLVHETALASLNGEFAMIKTSDEILMELKK